MKTLKVLGLVLLLVAMAYMTRYNVPKETYVVIDGQKVYGQYIDGVWYEPLEVYGGAIPDEFLESDN